MKRFAILAAILSALVPGLGQMYARKGVRGAGILLAVILVANLNAIWLSLFAVESHLRVSTDFWLSNLPRLLHDLFAFYGIVFLVWQIIDAYLLVNNSKKRRSIQS